MQLNQFFILKSHVLFSTEIMFTKPLVMWFHECFQFISERFYNNAIGSVLSSQAPYTILQRTWYQSHKVCCYMSVINTSAKGIVTILGESVSYTQEPFTVLRKIRF